MKRALALCLTLALVAPAGAFAGDFDPSVEFEQKTWLSIHLGPLDLSITKAVVYLFLAAGVSMVLGIVLMRGKVLNRRLAVGEQIYEIAQTQVAEQGLPTKAIGRWFPFVATLMIFIWVVNMLGFVPLPLSGDTWHHIPVWGIYAATSSAVGDARARAHHVRLHPLRGHPRERADQVLQELDPRGAGGRCCR